MKNTNINNTLDFSSWMKIIQRAFYIIVLVILIISCSDETYTPATITFYPTLAGEINEPAEGATGTATTIYLRTSRVLLEESQVNIKITGNGAGYGSSYVTNPPPLTQGVITLTIPRGENVASFTFTPKYDGIVEANDYHYTFSIDQFNNSIQSTGHAEFKLTVKEPPLHYFDFNTCTGSPAGFTERIVTGAMAANTWGCTSFGYPSETTSAAEANAFGKGSGTSNSYLIMNATLDGSLYNTVFLKLLVYSRFSGAGEIKFKYSNNYSGTGNPEAAGVIWTDVPGMSALLPPGGSQSWTPVSGTIENVTGTTYLAIQYVGGTTSSASNWRLENLEIKATN